MQKKNIYIYKNEFCRMCRLQLALHVTPVTSATPVTQSSAG